MPLLTILFCIILLVLLVSWAKVNPFLAFLIVSLTAGLLLGIPLDKVTKSVQTRSWRYFWGYIHYHLFGRDDREAGSNQWCGTKNCRGTG